MCVCVCVCVRACFRRHNIALSGFLAIFTLFFVLSKKKEERFEKEKDEKRQEQRKRRKRKQKKQLHFYMGVLLRISRAIQKFGFVPSIVLDFQLFSVFQKRLLLRSLTIFSNATVASLDRDKKKEEKKNGGENGRNYKSRRGIETVESFFD